MPRVRALVIRVEDRPGMLGEIASALGAMNVNLRAVAKLLGDARVNIKSVFVSTAGGRKATAFLAVSDMKAALRALR